MRNLLAALAIGVLSTSVLGVTGFSSTQAHAAGKAAASVQFVELSPLVLPIIDGNGVNQTVSLVVSLEVSNPDAFGEVDAMRPRIKDAFIQELYGALYDHASSDGGVLQVRKIKAKLTTIAAAVLGEGKVDDVLLQVVQQRPV